MAEKDKKTAKNEKKAVKNLVESKKDVIFAPKMSKMTFTTEFNFRPIFEKMSSVPVKSLVPNEALSIREILVRSSRGQRLNVHTRFRAEGIPDNMYYPDDAVKNSETFHDTPPDDINDVVDLFKYKEDIDRRKADLEAKRKQNEKKKEEADKTPPPPGASHDAKPQETKQDQA